MPPGLLSEEPPFPVSPVCPVSPYPPPSEPPPLRDGDSAAGERAVDDGAQQALAHAHNEWDDVRTRKGVKVLRCRVCKQQFKLPSKDVPRCAEFLQDARCREVQCGLLHVHKQKGRGGSASDAPSRADSPSTGAPT